MVLAALLLAPPASAFLRIPCVLKDDPDKEPLTGIRLCIRTRASLTAGGMSAGPRKNPALAFGELYSGLHLARHASLHFRGQMSHLEWQQDGSRAVRGERSTESLFVQIGNPVMSRFRLSTGITRMPFGMNLRHLPQIYRELYRSERFWQHPRYVVRLGLEDFRSNQLDLGYAVSRNPLDSDDEERPRLEAMSMRYVFDIAALGGTRFVLSGMQVMGGERRGGAGVMNVNEDGARFFLEWVRIYPLNGDRLFEQVLRLAITPDPRRKGLIFEYEDELKRHWLSTLGYQYPVNDWLPLRLAATWVKPRKSDTPNHWFGMVSLGMDY